MEAQVLQLLETHKQAVENFRSENQATFESLREQLHAAKEAGDEETVAALREQMKELTAKRRMDRVGRLARNAQYVCHICGRAAARAANLCEPVEL